MAAGQEAPPLAGHVGVEQEVTVDGRTWRLARLERKRLREFMEWAGTVIKDPRQVAAEFLKMLPEPVPIVAPGGGVVIQDLYAAQRNLIVSEALREAQEHLSVTSPKVQQLLQSFDGVLRVMYLLLKPYQPDVTEEETYEFIMGLAKNKSKDEAQAEAERLVQKAAGRTPAPKGPAGESPASP